MYDDPSVAGGIDYALRFLSDIAFRWIPGTVQVMTGTAPETGVQSPVFTPITEPVKTSDVVHFLQTSAAPNAYDWLYHQWSLLVVLGIMLSLLFCAGMIYCALRILQVREHEQKRFAQARHSVAAQDIPKTHLRWRNVLERIGSDQERDWRLAILEADIMLNELLDLQGYRGETMGDKMKQVDRADFKTIDLAWEAHRARNTIAHQGSLTPLSAREARHVIGLYEQVFREFRFIE